GGALRGGLALAGGFLIGAVPALWSAGKSPPRGTLKTDPEAAGLEVFEKIGEKIDPMFQGTPVPVEGASGALPSQAADGMPGTRKHPWLQALSLILCLAGMALLFDSLGLRPWEYWLQRLRG
ncbi:MAG: hypothetical protein JWL81_3366, partial [Verrucomicrobiales bacterium]|nr:hypothetical protein [Verrucomicrobiales bacterium]